MDDPHYRRKLFAGIALLIFFTIALIGELMQDRIMRFRLGVFLCSVVLLYVVFSAAFAKNLDGRYDSAPNHEWFESKHNSVGQWCCNESDAHLYDGEYTINPDGSVTIGKETIEAYKVLTGPNPTGHAVWWYLDGVYSRTTYCFIPGAGA